MRYIIIICIYFLFSVGYVNSKNFERCSSNNNSYEIDECLKKLKSKLMNKNITLVIHYSDKSIYKNKNIFLNICGNNISRYKYTDRDGQLNIKLDSKYIANCKAKIEVNIISEFGLCPKGMYAKATWNSLELNDLTYFSCSN
tara:strand:+ start:171 stop:596 length:426 start_codon:yes stop_codon:yes gene_type:complete